MSGQPLVDESVIRRQQFQHAAIPAQNAIQKQIRFAAKCAAQRLVEIGEEDLVRLLGFNIPEVKPLFGKISHQRRGTRIRQHAAHLLFQHAGGTQLPLTGQIEQRIVRDAAPEKEREPGGQLQVSDRMRSPWRGVGRIALDAKQKLRADQKPLDGPLDPEVESAFRPAGGVEGHQALHIGGGNGPAVSAALER